MSRLRSLPRWAVIIVIVPALWAWVFVLPTVGLMYLLGWAA